MCACVARLVKKLLANRLSCSWAVALFCLRRRLEWCRRSANRCFPTRKHQQVSFFFSFPTRKRQEVRLRYPFAPPPSFAAYSHAGHIYPLQLQAPATGTGTRICQVHLFSPSCFNILVAALVPRRTPNTPSGAPFQRPPQPP